MYNISNKGEIEMFNNPYLNGGYNYNGMYPQMQDKQPIQNIFTNSMPQTNDYFMAKMLKANETAESQIVTQRTAFIDLANKKLSIKEVDGNITNYEIVLPLDEKDMKIMALEKQLNELKGVINNVSTSTNVTSIESTELVGDVKKSNKK